MRTARESRALRRFGGHQGLCCEMVGIAISGCGGGRVYRTNAYLYAYLQAYLELYLPLQHSSLPLPPPPPTTPTPRPSPSPPPSTPPPSPPRRTATPPSLPVLPAVGLPSAAVHANQYSVQRGLLTCMGRYLTCMGRYWRYCKTRVGRYYKARVGRYCKAKVPEGEVHMLLIGARATLPGKGGKSGVEWSCGVVIIVLVQDSKVNVVLGLVGELTCA